MTYLCSNLCRIIPLLVVLAGCCFADTSFIKPNIVYFYADDLGWGTVKANNPSSVLITPTIDALASTGINFTRGYGCMVCSPARSSQQTGFHQGHTWTDRNDPDKTKAIRAEDTTIATVLQGAGYRTGYYGKWGYGADSGTDNPAINNPQTLPINHGYDELLAELHHVRAHTYFQPTLWRSNTSDTTPMTALVTNAIAANNPLHPNYPAFQNDATYPTTAYADDTFAIAALDFVRSNAQAGQPFFVTLAFQTPHTPLGNITSMPKWFDAYSGVAGSESWANDSKRYAAMVTRMDAHMKNILDALEDPNNDGDTSDSVRDNTLVIFASDNGGQGGTPYSFFKTNGVLSGTKGSVQEGGIRVPTVMNWRGTIGVGQTSDMPTDVTDILPTLAELAGVPAPVGTDGVSIAPTLTGKGEQRQREFLTHESGSSWSIIKGDMKLRNNGKLYDLNADPSESNDIAGSNPVIVTELQAYATGEFAGQEDTVANSFRRWEGANGSVFEADASWSDPAYPASHPDLANDYSPNTPNARWNAVMKNTTAANSANELAVDAKLLAIEIGGNSSTGHTQTLTVPDSLTLTGRNEIRVSSGGIIELDGGTLDTLRWVDVYEGGKINRGGNITGHLFSSGKISLSSSSHGSLGSPGGTVAQEILANGGFETGAGAGARTYPNVNHWGTELGFPTSKTLAKTNDPHTGSYRAQIHGETTAPNGSAIQETGHTIGLNDQFRISFWHRAFSSWEEADKIRVELFYINDTSQRVNLFNATVTPANGTWNQSSLLPAIITDNNAVGRQLWILFTPDQVSESGTEWAGLDDISLTVDVVTPPTPVSDVRSLSVGKDFRQFTTGELNFEIEAIGAAGQDYSTLIVEGEAYLDGKLTLTLDSSYTPTLGDTFTIISATSITGRFQHADDMISVGKHHYRIIYGGTTVTLEEVAATVNGTPHWWLAGHGLGTDDLSDPDGDGVETWREYIAGTDPADGASKFSTSLDLNPVTQEHELQWAGITNRRYYVERSTDLITFIPVGGPFYAESVMNTYILTDTEETKRFYRISAERE